MEEIKEGYYRFVGRIIDSIVIVAGNFPDNNTGRVWRLSSDVWLMDRSIVNISDKKAKQGVRVTFEDKVDAMTRRPQEKIYTIIFNRSYIVALINQKIFIPLQPEEVIAKEFSLI